MLRCPQTASCAALAAGAAFLISALVGSFWFELALGLIGCGLGILLRRP